MHTTNTPFKVTFWSPTNEDFLFLDRCMTEYPVVSDRTLRKSRNVQKAAYIYKALQFSNSRWPARLILVQTFAFPMPKFTNIRRLILAVLSSCVYPQFIWKSFHRRLTFLLAVLVESQQAACARNYTVQAGDFCDKISAAQNVST